MVKVTRIGKALYIHAPLKGSRLLVGNATAGTVRTVRVKRAGKKGGK